MLRLPAVVASLVIFLLAGEVLAQQRGVPQNGYPDWAERMVLVYTNRSRADPVADLANCTVCAEKACYPNPLVPVIYNYGISRAARFHSANMRLTGCFAHHSPCALVTDISSKFDPNSGCDGAAACACQGGTATCTSAPCSGCTSTGARIGLFAPNYSGENIAYGYPTPRAVHYAWFHEPDTDSSCGFRLANGHRANMMSGHKSLGVGRSNTHYTQDFGSTGTPTGSLIAGGHEVGNGQQNLGTATNNVEFRLNYYDTRGAPLEAKINVDGACQNMALERGSASNATYFTSMALPGNACRRYVFSFKDPSGTIVLLPETGSYGVGGAGCADWVVTGPQACGGGGNTPPLILTQASASPSPVTGKTTVLSVAAGDDTGEASLSYTWAATGGPGGVSFSANGSNAAKSATATFSQPGSYTFQVTVTDPSTASATSSVTVAVERRAATVSVAPPAVTLSPSMAQQFTATVVDQWNLSWVNAPTAWATTGGGTFDAAGLFTAGAATGGPFTVTATSGSATGDAFVSVSSGPPDTIPPQVFITSPQHLSEASGGMTIGASATDNLGVAKVIFYVDDVQVGEDNSSPYTSAWNASDAVNGQRKLRARAVDFSGNASDAEITVTVVGGRTSVDGGAGGGSGGSDTSAPTVSIITPAANAVLSAAADVEAFASDNVSVTLVMLQLNGTTFATLTAPPWRATLEAGRLSNGTHQLTAIARDGAGNQATSAPVSVTVDTGPGLGCGCSSTSAAGTVLLPMLILLAGRLRRRAE